MQPAPVHCLRGSAFPNLGDSLSVAPVISGSGITPNRCNHPTMILPTMILPSRSRPLSVSCRTPHVNSGLRCPHASPTVGPGLGMKIYIDGGYYGENNAKISVFDHGLLYGDGIFEGIRAYNGRVFKLREHIDRLFCSAKAILLDIPMSHADMMRAVVETCRRNHLRDGYVRLVVTRGIGTLGLNPNRCKNPSVIIIAGKIQLYPPALYQNGMEIVTVPTVRNLHSALNPAIKSLNYLNNVLAKIEAANAGCEEAIMLNAEGFVSECTGDNVFIVKAGQLFTPPLSAGALYGITRRVVLELATESGLQVSEPNLTRYDLFNADECFLTGTGAELVPVVKIDGRVIGNGKPGPVTTRLVAQYQALTNVSGEPIYE
jgi:branched-chain amino acid aminotransferase